MKMQRELAYLTIYPSDQVHQPGQYRQALVQSFPLRFDTQGVNPSSTVCPDTLTHHVFRPDQVSLEHKFIWNTRCCCLALLPEPEVLHLKRDIFIPGTPVDIIVEVMLA